MLELKNINYTRDNKKILQDINLNLKDNKFIVITGPNGSGKSTLAQVIMGIKKADSGEVLLNGENITELGIDERANKGISFAFQQPVRFKGITVMDLLKMSAKKDFTKKEACDILSKVGLCANEYIAREVNDRLSGGELKRIEIATVALRNSTVTIFDEPEAGIDLWSFTNLIEVFEELKELIKGTIIIISHQERILNIADEIILLENGKIKKHGTKNEVMTDLMDNHNNSKKCCKVGGAK